MAELTDLQHELLLVDVNVSGIGDVAKRASDEIGRLREMLDTRIQACELRVNDKVILSVPQPLTMEAMARFKASWTGSAQVDDVGLPRTELSREQRREKSWGWLRGRATEISNEQQARALGRCDDG